MRDFLFDIGTAGLFAYLVHKKISSPFKNLVENMNRIAAGDLNTRISIDSPNEVYLIGSTFNVMVNICKRCRRIEQKWKRTIGFCIPILPMT